MPFDFAALESTYSEAASTVPDSDKRPAGKQEAAVVKFSFKKDKNGDTYLKVHLKIDSGEFAGRSVWNNQRMTTKQNMEWFRKNLRTCGVAVPAKMADFAPDDEGNSALLDAVIGKRVAITLKPRGDNDDLFFDKLLDGPPATPPPPAPVDPKNAEIPF
jgi:hypothetical protein